MEKWKWNPDNWRSDGFAATTLRNTLLFSLLEVKMNVFRRRNFDISSSYFTKFSPSANIYKQLFLLTRFFTKPPKNLRPYAIWSGVTVPTPSGNQPRSLENLESTKFLETQSRCKMHFLSVTEEYIFDFFSAKDLYL